ncbi:hypothetical protein FACS1894182_01080 [Bacteroidia bacterium]|nr:hypothetical protein FACS1894182_01080 [Bacteroidia bacterium]
MAQSINNARAMAKFRLQLHDLSIKLDDTLKQTNDAIAEVSKTWKDIKFKEFVKMFEEDEKLIVSLSKNIKDFEPALFRKQKQIETYTGESTGDFSLSSAFSALPTSYKIAAASAVVVAPVATIGTAVISAIAPETVLKNVVEPIATLKPPHKDMELRENKKKGGYEATVLTPDGNILKMEEIVNGLGPHSGLERIGLNIIDMPKSIQDAVKQHDIDYGIHIEGETEEQSLARKEIADIKLRDAVNKEYGKSVGEFCDTTNIDTNICLAATEGFGVKKDEPFGNLIYAAVTGKSSIDSWKSGQQQGYLTKAYKNEIEQQLGQSIDTSRYYFTLENPMSREPNSTERGIADLLNPKNPNMSYAK